MASQQSLELQIDSYQAQIAQTEAEIDAAKMAGDYATAADLEQGLAFLNAELQQTINELQNLTTVTSDPTYADFDQPAVTYADYDIPPTPDENEYAAETNRLKAQEAAAAEVAANQSTAETARLSRQGVTAQLNNTRSQATQQDTANASAQGDWRVRLQLAPNADYLYKKKDGNVGILKPLIATDGIIFPYTPTINVSYVSSYDPSELVHSNYKIYQYKSSSVDNITISCDFTAQDTFEANYLLAVIHFFRSVTKMFYGQDQNPTNGVPPPLCYLTGLGAFQFDQHPLAITNFTYNLPTDVDYIQAGSAATIAGTNAQQTGFSIPSRLGIGAKYGGLPPGPNFKNAPTGTVEPTYVPTKIQLSITAVPIVSRNDISKNFSLRDYATGKLLRGSTRGGAGIW